MVIILVKWVTWYLAKLLCNVFSVCNSGHFKQVDSCVLCNDNAIKETIGNATGCAETCDGITTVPNDRHTSCGECIADRCSE